MATYKVIPSAWRSTNNISNPTSAYADTTSSNYAYVSGLYSASVQLEGFDFSDIPTFSSIEVKIKVKGTNGTAATNLKTKNLSGQSSILSATETIANDNTTHIISLTMTQTIDVINAQKDGLYLDFWSTSGYPYLYMYGAEINVKTPFANKVIYDGDTLIDLTSDTAIASDVASGKTFHLASGEQATGALSPKPSKATATTSSSYTQSVSFTLSKEPSWFAFECSNRTSTRSSGVYHILYDGTTTYTRYANSNIGTVSSSSGYGWFSYSSGTLTIGVTTIYLGAADWELYYL